MLGISEVVLTMSGFEWFREQMKCVIERSRIVAYISRTLVNLRELYYVYTTLSLLFAECQVLR